MTHVKYVFKWTAFDADEAYVTGTFDDWSKTHKLTKSASGTLEREVELPLNEKVAYKYYIDDKWILDPHSPTEKDHDGNENNILTIDDLLKLPIVGADSTTTTTTTASALEKKEEATAETADAKPSSTQATGIAEEMKESAPVTEASEEAQTQTSITDKILEVAAPVTAAAAAAGAAVVGFMSSGSDQHDGGKLDRETSPIPGTFPDTPVVEKSEAATGMIDEVKKTDDEPVPETKAFGTGAEATSAGGFAAALAADAKANTPPTHIPSSSRMESAPETKKGDTFTILPVPSETAPEGTQPLADSTYRDTSKSADVGSLAPEPVPQKTASSLPPKTDSEATTVFEPVNAESNLVSSATTTTQDKTSELKAAALASSQHAAETAAKALSPDLPTPPTLNAQTTLSGLTPGAGVTAIGTATDNESDETGLSRLVATKSPGGEHVDVQADAKAAHVEPAIVLDDTKMGKPTVETLGKSGDAAVASTPVTVSVPTDDGVQEVHALGTAIVTDGGKESGALKQEILENGKSSLPEGALAHLNKEKEGEEGKPPAAPEKSGKVQEKGPATPAKDTPTKTPVSQASASKDAKRVSGVPSEAGTTDSGKKKKKGGFLRKLKKAFS